MDHTDLVEAYKIRIREFLDEAYAHLLVKSPDYEDRQYPLRTFRLSKDLNIEPWKGCLLRLGDKLSLVYTYVRNGEYSAHDESFHETMLDIVVYAALTAILIEMDDELSPMSVEVLLAKLADSCLHDEKPKQN